MKEKLNTRKETLHEYVDADGHPLDHKLKVSREVQRERIQRRVAEHRAQEGYGYGIY